jgi:intracellular sulfur oxidation DsrE/DsrF family protein
VHKKIIGLLFAAFISLASAQDIKAVYHITTGIETAAAALNNVKNHLDADPKVMIQDTKDSKGREFSSSVSMLVGRGVEFRVCNNTLVSRNISPDKLLMESKIVPSGVSEAAKLQTREGFAYIKP